MQIAVDFVQGTNGAYLEYIGNTFVVPTVDFHNPFDELHRAHNKLASENSVFECGHFYEAQYHGVGLPTDCTHVIWIDVDQHDMERLRKIKQFKFNDPDSIRPFGGWLSKPSYYDDNYVFKFKWSKMFAMNTFISELERMAKFLDIDFSPTGQLIEIHAEFLRRHHFFLVS